MAVIAAQAVRYSLANIENINLSHDLAAFEWSPMGGSIASAAQPVPGQGSLASAWPVEANGRAIETQRAGAWLYDWYDRVHISPHSIDLGNVVSVQTSPVFIWNAYLVGRTLQSIEGLDEGMQVSGQAAPPLLFAPLQELVWQLSVTPDGQPVLDTRVSWVFDNGIATAVRVTANRIIAWTFTPDWGTSITERLAWSTNILQSESFVEQRRALLLGPRREFEAQMYVEGRERQLLDMALFGWSSRIWALPIWPDIQLLGAAVPAASQRINCTTANLDFRANGLAMLRADDAFSYEVVEIEAVDATGVDLKRATQLDWPRGSRLYPARSAQLVEQPQLTRLTDQAQGALVHFRVAEVSDWPATMPSTQYRGWPVLEDRPDESEDLTSSFQRLLSELDSGLAIPLTTDIADRAMPVIGYRWLGFGRAERAAYRSLLYALRGQQRAMWVPTHADDLTIVAIVSQNATTLDIANIGYTRFGRARPGRCDIRIQLTDGSVLYRRITSSAELDVNTERLAIDAALGRDIEPSQFARVCWMSLCRGAGDTVEIEHMTDSEGLAASALTFRGVRDNEF